VKSNFKSFSELELIFEDESIIVLNKPAGLLSIPERFDKSASNLFSILKKQFGTILTVHRLDRDTSGVIIFAKNAESHSNLNTQFEKREVKKIYHCLIAGSFNKENLLVDIPLMPDPARKGVMIPSARGKESLTEIKLLEKFTRASLIEVNLITGRQHQIRAHCAAIGYPLLVDGIYGRSKDFYLSSIKKRYNLKKGDEEKPIISRITMHANSIEFTHPETKNKMSFQAAYPKDFLALLQVLRKYASIRDWF
jgi:RluA family pseudouridine synthase